MVRLILHSIILTSLCFSGWSATHDITIFDYLYYPGSLSVTTGDTVVWTAYGSDHTVTSDTGVFDSETFWPVSMPALTSYRFTFHEPGDYPYYCLIHSDPGGVMSAAIFVTGDATNQLPSAPVNLSPADGAINQRIEIPSFLTNDPPFGLTLRATAFSDPDLGDINASGEWRVRQSSDNQVIYDSGEMAYSSGFHTLPLGILNYGSTYSWQVRYKDNAGGLGDYSTATSFTTLPPTLSANWQGTNLIVTWPTNTVGFSLEFATNLTTSNWLPVSPEPFVVGGRSTITNSVTNGTLFFRLRKS